MLCTKSAMELRHFPHGDVVAQSEQASFASVWSAWASAISIILTYGVACKLPLDHFSEVHRNSLLDCTFDQFATRVYKIFVCTTCVVVGNDCDAKLLRHAVDKMISFGT
mmetsp:Transcript_19719/g.37074  ORF Transcript_19719/g.37074 Transcript_19719/m.37074 type:complete len:109 (+) Transcript_19719:124-450(+)